MAVRRRRRGSHRRDFPMTVAAVFDRDSARPAERRVGRWCTTAPRPSPRTNCWASPAHGDVRGAKAFRHAGPLPAPARPLMLLLPLQDGFPEMLEPLADALA